LVFPIRLQWERVAGAAKYQVALWYIHNDGTGIIEQVFSKEVTSNSYTPTSGGTTTELRGGRRYKWRVRALSGNDNVKDGSASREWFFVTAPQ
jgi:hypothetical protein